MRCHGSNASACLCIHSLHTRASSDRFQRPGVNAPTGFCSLHSQHCLSSRYFARRYDQSICSPPQSRRRSSRPIFAPFWNGAAAKGRYTKRPCRSFTRVNAMYAARGSPASPTRMGPPDVYIRRVGRYKYPPDTARSDTDHWSMVLLFRTSIWLMNSY